MPLIDLTGEEIGKRGRLSHSSLLHNACQFVSNIRLAFFSFLQKSVKAGQADPLQSLVSPNRNSLLIRV